MQVLKFGGTSVGSPERIKSLMDIIDAKRKQIVVLSAVSGTTNQLVAIGNALYAKDHTKANQLIKTLQESYQVFIQQLFTDKAVLTEAEALIAEHFKAISSFTQDLFTAFEERVVLAQGELISTALFYLHLKEKGIPAVLLPALDFMRTDADGEPDIDYTTKHLQPILDQHPSVNVFITQGYICRNAFGEIDNLKRGGSDYSASLIGAAIRAEEVQIWTDIDGMHNNDPRIVKNTRPLSHLSFDEAAELAYFGAKILHPQSILPARKYKIPVRLLNTMQPEAKGTLIAMQSGTEQMKAIAAKDGITAINVQSSRMLLAYGFLRKVFEVFERYKTPIDMITTSEVAVSVTIDEPAFLPQIIEELQNYGDVKVDKDFSIICVVGNFGAGTHGTASRVFDGLKHIPIRMISYGGSDNNVSLLVKTEDKNEALKSLHSRLFD